MNTHSGDSRFRVLVAGGGVAALEAAFALAELAGERVATSVLAPDGEFVYRPMTVREPFSFAGAHRYALPEMVRDAGAELITGSLARVDCETRIAHTQAGDQLGYDALLVALGTHVRPRYEHALTVDDRRLDETLRGLLQDVEEGYTHSIAFVSPGRMPWPLPMYELALMTASRAYETGAQLQITIVTPEDSPLAIFGANASDAVASLLSQRSIETITSAYAEVPHAKEVLVNPGARRLHADRIVALPELYGPGVRGLPLAEHGFIRVDQHMQVPTCGPVFAAGDATEFPVKHGGLAAQQADVAAASIAALAGAPTEPESFTPVISAMLLTGERPLYLTARITGGQGFSSEISDSPAWSPPTKIVARYLAPYLEQRDSAAA